MLRGIFPFEFSFEITIIRTRWTRNCACCIQASWSWR